MDKLVSSETVLQTVKAADIRLQVVSVTIDWVLYKLIPKDDRIVVRSIRRSKVDADLRVIGAFELIGAWREIKGISDEDEDLSPEIYSGRDAKSPHKSNDKDPSSVDVTVWKRA